MLLSLQSWTKWNNPTRNCNVVDIVLLKNENKKVDVQSVKLLIGSSKTDDNTVHYLERPVKKLEWLKFWQLVGSIPR